MTEVTPRLALGPVPYYWPREVLLEFYARMARAPVDIVYLGETVCAKRRALRGGEWLELAQDLERAGKQVVLSTLGLIEAASELAALRRLCDQDRFLVEANDMAAVQLLAGQRGFVAGPTVNIYNGRSLHLLAGLGMSRWVMPLELSRETLKDLQQGRPEGVETELLAFGRLPLASSARCFTARAHNLPKDDCRFRCLDYPDGLLLSTREDVPFLTLNGIQTQSARSFSLLGEWDTVIRMGVDVLRISPQATHTERIIELFDACRAGRLEPAQARAEAEALMPCGPCDGYWHGRPGMENLAERYTRRT
jgi:collagenase-like PrtC family protease